MFIQQSKKHFLSIFLIFCILSTHLFLISNAQAKEKEKEKSGSTDWIIGVVPTLDGNTILNSGINFDYLGSFNSGITFNRTARGETTTCEPDEYINEPSKQCRTLNVVKDTIFKLQALGYRINISEYFWFLPRVNAQYYSQERQTNLVDISQKRYLVEDGLLRSYQLNLELETGLKMGSFGELVLDASWSPVSVNKEATRGYDSAITIQNQNAPSHNIIYTGNLGNFTAYTETSLKYFNVEATLTFFDFILSTDMVIDFELVDISYEANAEKTIVENGELNTTQDRSGYSKSETNISLGNEVPFVDLMGAKLFASFDYTKAKYGGTGSEISENVFGFGLTIKH